MGGGLHEKARSGLLNPEPLSLFWYSVNGERALQTCIIPFLHRQLGGMINLLNACNPCASKNIRSLVYVLCKVNRSTNVLRPKCT